MEEKIICEECNIKFTMKKNLYAHLRRMHDKDPVEPKVTNESCDICGQQFVNKSNNSRHQKRVHGITASKEKCTRNSRIKCPLENCSQCFRNYADFRKHLTGFHKMEIEYIELQFESSLAFHQWRDQMQECSLSSYVLNTSFKLLADGSKKEFYDCHRSYNYIQKGKNLRHSKSKGTNKIGKACPSRIEVLTKSSEGPVLVKFWMTHVGHSLDIARIFLSKKMRAEIAGKLKEGVTFEHILDDIRDAGLTKGESQRILLLNKKDMHNIARDFRIDYSTKRHHNDAISIKLNVEDMKNLGDECPVSYKEQGIESDFGVLDVKHIHSCKSVFFKDSESESMVDSNTENNSATEDILLDVNRSCHEQQQSVKTGNIKGRAELVIGLCDTISLTDEEHRSILNNFDKIINIMNKRKTISLKTEKSNSNEKIEKQVRLFSTKKKMKAVSKFKKPTIVS